MANVRLSIGKSLAAVMVWSVAAAAAAAADASAPADAADYAPSADGTRVRTRYDLDRRVYLGVFGGGTNAGESGTFTAAAPRLDFGVRFADYSESALWRRVHEIARTTWDPLGAPLGRFQLSAYKGTFTRHSEDPGITIGSRHFRVPLYVGFDVEGLRLDAAPRAFGHFLDWDLVRSSVFLDLAHSRDMRSYLRLLAGFRFGVAFPREERQSAAAFFGPTAGLEARWQGRLQAATLTAAFSRRIVGNDLGWRTDLRATAEYEVVLFAIAEQPASAVLQLHYGYDDRFGAGLPTSTFGVLAGLRLSFGAK